MSGLYIYINLSCSCVYDAFDQITINIFCVFYVFLSIILLFESNFFFLIDCLNCPSKLYWYTNFLVNY